MHRHPREGETDLQLDLALDAQPGVVRGQLRESGQHASLVLEGVLFARPEQAGRGRGGEAYTLAKVGV